MLVGLPASGKSSISEQLIKQMPAQLIRSDQIRKTVVPNPTYTPKEIDFVYAICHELIRLHLRQGERVIFDAVNYLAKWRITLAEIAGKVGATLTICHIVTTPEISRNRMNQRWNQQRHSFDNSDANFAIYKELATLFEPITQPHHLIDSSHQSPEKLAMQLCAYWQKVGV